MALKKIVVIGPESTGKSTLCSQLAAHYNTLWVPEYAREFLLANGKEYTFEDLYEISIGQITSEEALALEAVNFGTWATGSDVSQPFFVDTNLHVIQVWSEFVFNKCDNRVLNQVASRQYDLFLLCNTDLPWEKDALREYPDLEIREKLFHHYKEAMINQSVPWVEIHGGKEGRLELAIRAVDQLLG